MKVMMLTWEYPPIQVGGLARHVCHLSRSLSQQGTRVAVVTLGGHGTVPRETDGNLEIVRTSPYFSNAPDFTTWVMHANFALLEAALELTREWGEPDIVHAHDWLVVYSGKALKNLLRIPLTATIHATEHGRNNGIHNSTQKYISDMEWWLTYEAWKVVCCSRYMREELQRVFNLPGDKIRVIPNGVALPEAGALRGGARGTDRRDFFAGPKERIIFHVGRQVPEKGGAVLLDAFATVLKSVPEAKLIMAGSGPWGEELRRRARSLGIERKVLFTGYLQDETVQNLYRWAEVAVFPSTYEPFGIVALEAMASGTPVVVSDVGGLSEIVEHEVDGLKTYAGSSSSLSDQILRILGEPELARRLSQAARAKVARDFAWDEIARETTLLYRQILSESAQTPWVQAGDRVRSAEDVPGPHSDPDLRTGERPGRYVETH